MAKEVSKTAIGAFVISAIALIVIGVITFGSGRFFTKTITCVLFFEGSVKGLNKGAPVVWRGVKIGSVTDIILLGDRRTMTMQIPVIIDVDPASFRIRTADGDLQEGTVRKGQVEDLVKLGLKAKLTMQSIVTGQLMIDMDLYPDVPIKLVRSEYPYPEIPTMQSTLEQLAETVQKLPIKQIIEKLERAADNIAAIAGDSNLKTIVADAKIAVENTNRLIANADKLVVNVNRQVEPLAESMTTTAEDAQDLIRNVDRHVDPVALKVEGAIDAATAALERAEKTLEGIEELTAEGSVTNHRVNSALEELTRAARSVRVLSDYLGQYPDAPLRGKGARGGK